MDMTIGKDRYAGAAAKQPAVTTLLFLNLPREKTVAVVKQKRTVEEGEITDRSTTVEHVRKEWICANIKAAAKLLNTSHIQFLHSRKIKLRLKGSSSRPPVL